MDLEQAESVPPVGQGMTHQLLRAPGVGGAAGGSADRPGGLQTPSLAGCRVPLGARPAGFRRQPEGNMHTVEERALATIHGSTGKGRMMRFAGGDGGGGHFDGMKKKLELCTHFGGVGVGKGGAGGDILRAHAARQVTPGAGPSPRRAKPGEGGLKGQLHVRPDTAHRSWPSPPAPARPARSLRRSAQKRDGRGRGAWWGSKRGAWKRREQCTR